LKRQSIYFVIIILIFFASQKVFSETNFVGSFGSPTGNYFTVIQDAVDNTSSNGMVIVSNGVYNTGGGITPGYACSNRVVITNNIIVKSANGPENTVIMGAPDPVTGGLGDNAVRGVYMSAGVLSGFTISNGFTMASGNGTHDRGGGGISIEANGIVTNCIIIKNFADVGGGASVAVDGVTCIFNNCIIEGNRANLFAGGTAEISLNNCTINGNSANLFGGGCTGGTLNNCTISNNSAEDGDSGGCHGGKLNNCIISQNYANKEFGLGGGGCYGGILNNCIVIGNSAVGMGGGGINSTAYNCLIVSNSVNGTLFDGGGGAGLGSLYNCTIVGNVSSNFGGGTDRGTLENCIVYYNSAPSNENVNGGTCSYSCAPDILHGINGNITNIPRFINIAMSNYHLSAISSCINSGTNAYAAMPVDLDGWPRIIGGTVDMGCYEYAEPPQFATNSLVFPANNSVVLAPYSTNIIWDFNKITDDNDGTNLTITKVSVFLAEITNEISIITNNVSNLSGQILWLVPENLVGGDTNYVLQFEVVDNDSLTNSRIFWDNKFTVVPEGGIVFSILCLVFSIFIFRRKIKKIPLTPFPAGVGTGIKGGIIAALIFATSANGSPLTIEQAEQAARNFICLRYPAKTGQIGCTTKLGTSALDISNVELFKLNKKEVGFVVNLSPSGYVLMRADDETPPLKLYSDKGSFSNLPPDFVAVMKEELRLELEFLRKTKLTRTKTIETQWEKDWRELIKGENANALETYSDKVPVKMARTESDFRMLDDGPLLTPTIKWHQNYPYNYFCPEAPGPHGRAYAGCVATAMAQIMKFHNHPIRGASSHSYTDSTGVHFADFENTYYDWGNMPTQLFESSPQIEIEAVALLMYHCGVSVDMGYGGSGSGANLFGYELEKYFRYRCNDIIPRGSSDSNWYAKIEKDIEGNLPIYYTFRTLSSGHAVVCDGCRSNNQIYINFGWGGAYNAWYNMNNIAGGYNHNHKAIFKIRPCGTNSIYYVDPTSPNPASPYATWDTAAHTIEEALYICGNGQTTIVASGEYYISNTLEVSVNVTLISNEGASNTIINGSGLRRCVNMRENAVLDGFTITNGCADNGGGVYGENNPVIRNCIITGNNATNNDAKGGGVYSFSGIIISNCIISGNSSKDKGGGLCFWGGGILNDCIIKKNSAMNSGGGGYFNSGSYLSNCVFSGNLAQNGGGMYLSRSKVADSIIAGNSATNINIGGTHGGGVYCSFESSVQNCVITQNTVIASSSYSGGGGIYCYPGAGTTIVNKCTIERNIVNVSAWRSGGGGIYCNGFSLAEVALITDCQIRYNSIDYNSGGDCGGGGIFFRNIGIVRNCVLQGNNAGSSYYGGGVFCYNGGLVNNCAISDNSADYGGGICFYNGGNVQNSLLTHNYASAHGGGAFCNNGGEIKNCTISDNSANQLGGGVCNGTIFNSIIYFNSGMLGNNIYGVGTFEYCCTTPNPGGEGNITVDPDFVNTGSGDYHLSSTSPCINTGTNNYTINETDKDGNPRIIGGTVDMGCYEFYTETAAFSPPEITSPFPVPSGGNSCFAVTNWQNITFSGTKPVNTFAVRPWLPDGIEQFSGGTTWTNSTMSLNITETGASNFFYYRSMSNDYQTFSANTTIVCVVNYAFGIEPFVDITNTDMNVSYEVDSISISGTNNSHVTGTMTWENSLTSSNGTFPASIQWDINDIALGIGENVITVTGMDMLGNRENVITVTGMDMLGNIAQVIRLE